MIHNILLSLDPTLFRPSLNLINSIVKHNNYRKIAFYIIVSSDLDYYKKMLTIFKKCKFNFTIRLFDNNDDVNFLTDNIKLLSENSSKKTQYIFHLMNFARFHIPDIFPEIDHGIYLDIDMINQQNFDKILEEFNYFEKDFDIISPMNMKPEDMNLDKIGIKSMCFNAGFYIWNLKKYRQQNLLSKVKDLIILQKNENIWKLGTQPILNIIYENKVIDIDKRWNSKGYGKINVDGIESKKARDAYIIHWNGPIKPWDNNNVLCYNIWESYST